MAIVEKSSEVGCSFRLYSVSIQAADPTPCDPWPIEIGYGVPLLAPHYTPWPRGGVVKKKSHITRLATEFNTRAACFKEPNATD